MTHLWEPEHAYHCEGYAENGSEFDSWDDYVSQEADGMDPHYNHLFRWDWRVRGDDDCERNPHPDPYYRADELLLFFVSQRKSRLRWVKVRVCAADEPAVRAWLEKQWSYVAALWSPISDQQPTKGNA